MTDELVERLKDKVADRLAEIGDFPVSYLAANAVDTCLAEIAAAGRSIVPNEPTADMIEAGAAAAMKPRMHVGHTKSDMGMTVSIGYTAMLSASRKV